MKKRRAPKCSACRDWGYDMDFKEYLKPCPKCGGQNNAKERAKG